MEPFLGSSVTTRTTSATSSAAPPSSTASRLEPEGGATDGVSDARGRISVGAWRGDASVGAAGTGGGGGGTLGGWRAAGGGTARAAPPELERSAPAAPTFGGALGSGCASSSALS